MGEAKNCPKCGLVNTPSAQRCDCGWDFVSQRQEQSYMTSKSLPVAAGIGSAILVAVVLLKGILRFLAEVSK